ncbi:MAG TPA: STAS domain-containing protein [Terriglobales bacterium]|nr:STAS domain-containing protein [Terriglobales bacterium]
MFEITPRVVDQVLVLDCNGRMAIGEDLAFFKNFLKQLLLTTDALVVNLEGVTYMDSSGLSIVVASYTSARERGATMKLAGINSTIRDLFRITRLLELLDIHQSVDQAVRAFPSKAASA